MSSATQGMEAALSSMSIRLTSQELTLGPAENNGVNISHFLRHRNSKQERVFFFLLTRVNTRL